MNSKLHTLIKSTQQIVLAVIIILLPVFFLPITADFYTVNKQTLLLLGVSALTILSVLEVFVTSTFKTTKSRFMFPLVLFFVANLISTYFASINKMESWLTPIGTGSILLLTAFYWFVSQQSERGKKIISFALILSGAFLSVVVFQQFIGVSTALSRAAFLKDPSWTPTGASFSTFLYLLGIIIFTIPWVYTLFKSNRIPQLALSTLALILMFLGIAITSYQLFALQKPTFLPQKTGWYIALDTLKEHALIGYGPENFMSAFTKTKPIEFNQTPVWNIRFDVSSNLYFHLFTTLGLFGFITFGLFVTQVALSTKTKTFDTLKYQVPLLVLLLVAFLFPPTLLLFFLIYVFAGLLSSLGDEKSFSITSLQTRMLFVIPIFLIGYGLFMMTKVYAGETNYRKSLTAISNKQATQTYQNHQDAINNAPWNDLYRISYSQTSLSIANSLAQKKDLTDEDRKTLNQLIQQSINEAKNAVTLNNTRVTNWENLGAIYKQLIQFAKQADEWSISTFSQAISLDPLNPLLRIELGSILYLQKKFPESIRQYEIAVGLKPDFANSHYNLALAYRENKEIAKAIKEMETVLTLVKTNSEDYTKAKEELEKLKATSPGISTTPVPETTTEPPLSLPDEAAPPATSAAQPRNNPSPTPTQIPAPTPSINPSAT